MSKSLKKKSHWTSKVHESVIGRNPEGQLGFELKGGAENGQFPYLGEVKPGKVAYESGSKLVSEELLLEVNETPVAGLTIRDVLAVIKHCKDPLRLKCVKQVRPSALEGVRPGLTSALSGQIECASVASPQWMKSFWGRKEGNERKKGRKRRKEQLEGAVASLAGLRGAEGGGVNGELRPAFLKTLGSPSVP
ncbi:Membrane-associated guanylate kinase, WW and PDZ domain-containing protein 2 [Tupaia chinensis]|uniref:Membrane-associated guanylate kinase, WW and PDZ domain-containing protein 2 n=1 Tax=Tupaia chinensis TaxID=246437 RepID=L9KH21_TUPCH|nr:Membrane-associated guanylate kinase, WW and PDZ domain-containing protein 2 [Tupaia chinensis]